MEPSKEAIALRITRLNRQILGKVNGGASKLKRTIDREALLDALTVLYDECNDDPVKKCDDLVKAFVDKYRSTLAELRRTRVCISDFEILQTIGRGHFGEVHMVKEKHTGDVYALKTVKKESARRREVGMPEDERDVLAIAHSPWIPRLQYAFQDSSTLYLVMELCCGGDLAGLLSRRNNPLAERDAAFYVAEVAHALKTLHGMGYVHRDVKPHNILLDRCGHVKLGDFGSVSRLSEGGTCGSAVPVGTPDYVAPELLAAADCGARHTVCLEYCRKRGLSPTAAAISACDYWSLGVVAFEMVTLKRPFSSEDDDSISEILANIQKYESDPSCSPPFEPLPYGPSSEWRSLVAGLLRVPPSRRFNYLDTLQHPALAHLNVHSIRDQAPPWVPCTRGAEDASHFAPPPRVPPPPSAAPFRARPPFAGQLPFVGFSYVASDETEDHSGGFNVSHECTAIDLATFKSAEKLAAMRGREIASLQNKVAAAEAAAAVEVDRARRNAQADVERLREELQAEITNLTMQKKRLERQIEVEKEERVALQRSNQQLLSAVSERTAEARSAQAEREAIRAEREALRAEVTRLEARAVELQADCARAAVTADATRKQHQHYKDILEHAQELRHRRLTEINVRAIDTIAKERMLRRQTLSGGEAESREAGARIAQAQADYAREKRARELAERRLAAIQEENESLRNEVENARKELAKTEESLGEKQRSAESTSDQVKELQAQLAQERTRVSTLQAQVQELQKTMEESCRRETELEEQSARTEARLHQRAEAAEARAAAALSDDARHREKVSTLESLVRQLEREVTALEQRTCPTCASREDVRRDASDTESVAETLHVTQLQQTPRNEHNEQAIAQVALLKEQLDRAENQLQARAEEIAALRQEARTANLARWRKEREYNDLSVEAKSTARDLKRAEERLTIATEARKKAEQKASELQNEIATLKPQYDRASKEVERLKEQLTKLQKGYDTAQAEVDRSRNDIRKLKSELQYSEKRRLHAEEQEELSSRERAQLRDELTEIRTANHDLVQNNKALQEACALLEEQLDDLEKLADLHEIKNKELESETQRLRAEAESYRSRLSEAEKLSAERAATATLASQQYELATEMAKNTQEQLQLVTERLESREQRVIELEARATSLEGELSCAQSRVASLAQRVHDLQEECAAVRTRAQDHHALAMKLQASLAEAQEEISALREAQEAAAAWWRTRETKADATLRQQAKLIDFLQTKVEEANRKKCPWGNKLFGRSGRRASSPLRRTNRELREEIDRLRAKLASNSFYGESDSCPPTPTPKKTKPAVNGKKPIPMDRGDGVDNDKLQIVWSDGSREQMQGKISEGVLVLTKGNREMRARLLSTVAKNLPHNEANRAFVVKVDDSLKGSEATVICGSLERRSELMSLVSPPPPSGYHPASLAALDSETNTALYLASDALALGCSDGLHSLRGPIHLELESDVSPPRHTNNTAITSIAAVCGRALVVAGSKLVQGNLLALASALRRSTALKPALGVTRVRLPDNTPPHLVQVISGEQSEGICAAVACGRRVFLLRFDASATEFRLARSLTIDRSPDSLLLTPRTLYIAGEKPLKIKLPSGALEAFGMDDMTVASASKKHSPPKAILLINENPVEILLCYAECGVFVDESGTRTRNEEPKWSSAVRSWVFVKPFLYLIGEDRVTIIYITEEAYKAPPCTCDTHSVTSTASECYMPEVYNLKVKSPSLLGTAPNGIIIQTVDNGYNVSIVDGLAAFRSVGASVESLCTLSNKGSSSDLAQSLTDLAQSMSDLAQASTDEAPHDESRESVEANTGFLADIRKRAKQLRLKNRMAPISDDIINDVMAREVKIKRTSNSKKSPETSDCNTDSEDTEQNGTESSKKTADLCAEIFTRQVRF